MKTRLFRTLPAMLAVALGLVVFASPARAAEFTVTNTEDSGEGSLRAALEEAAQDHGTQDVILFGEGARGKIELKTALPPLGDVEVRGPGAGELTVARSAEAGTPEFRIFTAVSGRTITISGLTISGGRAVANDCRGTNACLGGGVYQEGGSLTVENSVVKNNFAGAGGGVFGQFGGLKIVASTISGNASNAGGGLFHSDGAATIVNSTVHGNSATGSNCCDGQGGGVFLYSLTTSTITNSTISGNSADRGGAARSFGRPPNFLL